MSMAAVLGANRAECELEVGSHRSKELGVLSLAAREELSRPYEAVVTFAADPGLDTGALEGAEARGGGGEGGDGVAEGWERRGRTSHPEKHGYRLRVRPRLWLLSGRQRSRIFQGMTAVEIAVSVLKEWQVVHRLSLTGSYAKREYCVQSRETDLDFASRLLEEGGVFSFFEHGEGTTTGG